MQYGQRQQLEATQSGRGLLRPLIGLDVAFWGVDRLVAAEFQPAVGDGRPSGVGGDLAHSAQVILRFSRLCIYTCTTVELRCKAHGGPRHARVKAS